jgi:hypothetical protein
MRADATAAKINQIGGGALRRPRRAAPLPSDDWPRPEDVGLEDVRIEEEEEEEDRAMTLM